jgi:uncharacterized membrane protein YphA (DoxX/SURF4 family)
VSLTGGKPSWARAQPAGRSWSGCSSGSWCFCRRGFRNSRFRTFSARVASFVSHPLPRRHGPFVGVVEIVCGALIIVGLFTRLAAIPLIVIMIVAIASTKVPILLGHDFWIFHVPKLASYGFWSMAHEARADLCMLLGALYLLIEGAGKWSLDALLSGHRSPHLD